MRKTAALTGENRNFVYDVLRENGVSRKTTTSVLRLTGRESHDYGRIADWLKRHQDRKIPHDYAKLAEVIGVTRNALKCYFYRRRRSVLSVLRTLPNLTATNVTLADEAGAIVACSSLESYEYLIDRVTLDVSVWATLRDGSTRVFPIPNWRDFANRVGGPK